jgi:hypothetical protein
MILSLLIWRKHGLYRASKQCPGMYDVKPNHDPLQLVLNRSVAK